MDGQWTVNPLWTCVREQVRFLPSAFLRGSMLVIGNRSVSKTEDPGSSPGTPVRVFSYGGVAEMVIALVR